MTDLQIELRLLYHFADKLEERINDATCLESLGLLESYAKKFHKETSRHISNLLEKRSITHDLLWTLYKPGDILYTTCTKTNRPRAVRFVHGVPGRSSFRLDCRYIDNNGTSIGEAALEISIPSFHGCRDIDSLIVFPLKYHANEAEVRQNLLHQGNRFLSLQGCHHQCYDGFAVPAGLENNVSKVAVESKIMVDPSAYYQVHPYSPGHRLLPLPQEAYESSNVEKEDSVEVGTPNESSRLICCPLVLGYSLSDQNWCMRVTLLF